MCCLTGWDNPPALCPRPKEHPEVVFVAKSFSQGSLPRCRLKQVESRETHVHWWLLQTWRHMQMMHSHSKGGNPSAFRDFLHLLSRRAIPASHGSDYYHVSIYKAHESCLRWFVCELLYQTRLPFAPWFLHFKQMFTFYGLGGMPHPTPSPPLFFLSVFNAMCFFACLYFMLGCYLPIWERRGGKRNKTMSKYFFSCVWEFCFVAVWFFSSCR